MSKYEKSIVDLMATIPFLDNLTQWERQDLASMNSIVERLPPSRVIVQEGGQDAEIFILLKGVVRIVKNKPKEVTLTKLKSGTVFGELAWVGKRARTTSVISDGDVTVLKIDLTNADELYPIVAKKLKDKIIEIIIMRLDQMNEQLSQVIR